MSTPAQPATHHLPPEWVLRAFEDLKANGLYRREPSIEPNLVVEIIAKHAQPTPVTPPQK